MNRHKPSQRHCSYGAGATVALIGCSGRIGAPIVAELLREGLVVRVLARRPAEVRARLSGAEVVCGSMFDPDAAARVMAGADAALLITPIPPDDRVEVEVEAARVAVRAAREAGLPHLIFVSVIGIDVPTGVPLLDAKADVERLLAGSGLRWTSLRSGCYMDDLIDARLGLIRWGVFPLPVRRDAPLSFTSQRDIGRVAARLIREGRALEAPLDVVEPAIRTPADVATVLSQRGGRRVVALGAQPWLALLRAARPILRRRAPRLATIARLPAYFQREGYAVTSRQLPAVMPGFMPTTMEEHLTVITARIAPARGGFNPISSAVTFCGYLLRGRVHFPRERVGRTVVNLDGRVCTIIKEGFVDRSEGQPEVPGAMFRVRFHLRRMSPRANRIFLHLPIPFFMGLPGFRHKLWLYDEETGDFQGRYLWDTVEDAERYARSIAVAFMTRRSLPGVTWAVTANPEPEAMQAMGSEPASGV